MAKAFILFALFELVGNLASITTAFVPPRESSSNWAAKQVLCPSILSSECTCARNGIWQRSSSILRVQKSQAEKKAPAAIGPSVFYMAFSAVLGKLCIVLQDSSLPITIGTSSLFFVSAAVAYDNLIIGLGNNLFPNARTDETQYNVLKVLSYPRFVFLAFLFSLQQCLKPGKLQEWNGSRVTGFKMPLPLRP